MMKFNALQFVSNLSADLAGEFDELEEMIQKGEDAEGVHRAYNHLGSMIQGFEYMAEFIEGEDDRKELAAILAQKREEHDGFYPRAASIIYSARLGKDVRITVFAHADGTETIEVLVEGHCERTFGKADEVKDEVKAYINSLAEGEA